MSFATRRAFLLSVAAAALANNAYADEPLTVFAAASLQESLTDIGQAFERRNRGARVRFSFAASSTLARQIEQGAPADLFVSADEPWMDYLEERGLLCAGGRIDLLSNRLALVAPAYARATLRIAPGFPLARALGQSRLAIADPASVPAGRYAEAALKSLGVWNDVQMKLARAENVRAALAFVARGEASFGIVYATDARIEPRVKIVDLFPEATHPRILYPAAIVNASAHPRAPAFLAALHAQWARAIFTRYGFSPL
ncbi:MAG: molybdate ABC transporter substrate-binding protein [Hyphomonadaceae bacterium]|nr:molybdate ABC transporter substrate-binding protein [Hyphomonadaceae bacterium]